MKQLRILTGVHAGAQLALKHRQYRIASDEQADIQLTDWDDTPLTLAIEDKGTQVQLALHHREEGAPHRRIGVLEDFVPRRFGDVVLCAGPADGAWPSDVDLMATWMRGPARGLKALRPTARLTWGALGAAVMLIGGLAAVVSGQTATSATMAPPSPMERVQQALRAAGITELQARQVDRRVVVEGLLPDSMQVARVRAALQPFGEDVLLHRYAAATDVARQISDALNNPGIGVTYAGHGVFKVQGQTVDTVRLTEDIKRVAADAGPLVARIEIDVSESLPAGHARVGAMWHGDDLQYVQTADGTKHLSLQTPIVDGAVPAGGSLPPSPLTSDGEHDDQPSRADGVR